MSSVVKAKFYVVQTPTGDRLYVSTQLPQSYVDEIDRTDALGEVYEVDVTLPTEMGGAIFGREPGSISLVSSVRRLR